MHALVKTRVYAMKRLLSVLLAIMVLSVSYSPGTSAVTTSSSSQAAQTQQSLANYSRTAGFEFDFQPATSIWKDLVGSESPATLQASYTLQGNVKKIDTADANIKSPGQILSGGLVGVKPAMQTIAEGAYINKSVLQNAAGTQDEIQPGAIFMNGATGTAFKVVVPMDDGEATAPFKDEYSVTQPQISEIFSDYQIPLSSLNLRKANIDSFAGLLTSGDTTEKYVDTSDTSSDSPDSPYTSFKYIQQPLIKFIFPDGTKLKGYVGNGQEVTVAISGGVAISDLNAEARYSSFHGYRFAVTAKQESYLTASVGISVNQEIRIPLFGINIPFPFGHVSGGMFLIVAMDGDVRMDIQAREYTHCTIGLTGGTFMSCPVSCAPFFTWPAGVFEGDVDVDGPVNGYIKTGALLSLDLLGWDLVGAGISHGVGVGTTSADSMLDIELYGLGQTYITFMGKTFQTLNARPVILHKKQRDMGGFRATIEESCAYRDLVAGYLQMNQQSGGDIVLVRAANTDFQIVVDSGLSGTVKTYPSDTTYYKTDGNGNFLIHDDISPLVLKYNDQVSLKVRSGDQTFGPSLPVEATYPFSRVEITHADGFNDWIEGQVDPARVRNWDKKPGEEDYEILRFQGEVTILLQKKLGYIYRETIASVHAATDANGHFKAENGSLKPGDPVLDVKSWSLFTAVIDDEGALASTESFIKPYTHFEIRQVMEPVAGSTARYVENGKTIDKELVNVRTYIINMGGSKPLTGLPVACEFMGFSTQDLLRRDVYLNLLVPGLSQAEQLPGLFPGAQTLVLQSDPADEESNGTSYFDMAVTKEWAWPAHTKPTVITSADHYECTTAGGSFTVTADGVNPFTFGILNAPDGVGIVPYSGVMTISNTLAPGVYPFTVVVSGNPGQTIPIPVDFPDYAEDPYPPVKQAFTLTITDNPVEPSPSPSPTPEPSPTPQLTPTPTLSPSPSPSPTPVPTVPVITSADRCTLPPDGTGSFQVTAVGTMPITFSLMRNPVQVRIDPASGLLTTQPDFTPGDYPFIIRAQNSVGYTDQQFYLTIKSSVVRGFKFNNPILGNIVPNLSGPVLNQVALRNDDPKDLFSDDMLVVDGSGYVKWDLLVRLTADDMVYTLLDEDESLCNDHHLTHLTDQQKAKLEGEMKELEAEYNDQSFGPDLGGDPGDLDLDDLFQSTILDYGGIVDMIQGQKDGISGISLGGGSGTFLPGSVFNALKEAGPDAGLALNQPDAEITFMSKNIGKDADYGGQLFDLAFYADAGNADAMKQAAGSGASSFTFAFAHNGNLPGMAQFSIRTNLAEGSQVNVYKYDSALNQFSQIAGGARVGSGGVVTYMNNMTSEYIITTGIIEGAIRTDAYTLFNNKGEAAGSSPVMLLTVLTMGVAGGMIVLYYRIRRIHKKKAASGS